MICHNQKFVFFHIPKTGGSSILQYFKEASIPFRVGECSSVEWRDHGECSRQRRSEPGPNAQSVPNILPSNYSYRTVNIHYDKINQEIIDNYFKFAFHRNPWDRMVSLWKWHTGVHSIRFTILKKYKECINFEGYCYNLFNIFDKILPSKERVHLINQCDINGHSKDLQLDFWGRFSHLREDFAEVCDILKLRFDKLPHINSSNRANYKIYYNENTKKFVSRAFEKDIDIFKYTFDN